MKNKSVEERLARIESDIERIRESLNYVISIVNTWLMTEYPGWGDQISPV